MSCYKLKQWRKIFQRRNGRLNTLNYFLAICSTPLQNRKHQSYIWKGYLGEVANKIFYCFSYCKKDLKIGTTEFLYSQIHNSVCEVPHVRWLLVPVILYWQVLRKSFQRATHNSDLPWYKWLYVCLMYSKANKKWKHILYSCFNP